MELRIEQVYKNTSVIHFDGVLIKLYTSEKKVIKNKSQVFFADLLFIVVVKTPDLHRKSHKFPCKYYLQKN